jgi:hypothetical protein
MTSALSRNCLSEIACASICLLLMAACSEQRSTAFDKEATSNGSEHWVSEATELIEKLSGLANTYSQVPPPKSFADLRDNLDKYKDWPSSGKGSLAEENPDRTLWKLWLLTGMPPLAELPEETIHDSLQRNVLGYREYVAMHATLSEEALHRVGLTNSVGSIGSPLWYMTLEYLATRANLTHDWIIDVRTTPSSVLTRCPLDKAAYAHLSAALSRWMRVNEGQMVWSPHGRRFYPSGGEYRETVGLLKTIVKELETARLPVVGEQQKQ